MALALACVSAAFSIDDLTAIFAGAFWPVITMGAALEAGKLVAAAWLTEHWNSAPSLQRLVLVTMIGVLMGLNAVGVFGFGLRTIALSLKRCWLARRTRGTATRPSVNSVFAGRHLLGLLAPSLARRSPQMRSACGDRPSAAAPWSGRASCAGCARLARCEPILAGTSVDGKKQ